MFDLDKWHEILHAIRKNKTRTLLTAFGVFWGIFMLVILLGAGKGLENGVTQNFDIAKNAVFVWSQATSLPYKGLKPGRHIQFTNRDVELLDKQLHSISHLAPRLQMPGSFQVSRKQKSASFTVSGDYPDFLAIKPLIVEQGRFLNPNDLAEKRKVAVVGRRILEVLFEPSEDPIGQSLAIKGVYFKVIGTFSSRVRGEAAQEDAETIFIPLTTLQQAFNRPQQIDWFAFIPKSGTPAKTVEQQSRALLARAHTISPQDERALGVANVEEEFKEIQGIFLGIRLFSWLVAIGTIFSGMVGVGNIMMVVVRERTLEIGIRKAVGARPFSIVMMIVKEALLLTSLAGYLGLVAGVAAIEGVAMALQQFNIESEFFANPEVDFQAALTSVLLLSLAGISAGLIPGLKAARLSPVKALQAS